MTSEAIKFKYENFGELHGNPIHDLIYKGRPDISKIIEKYHSKRKISKGIKK